MVHNVILNPFLFLLLRRLPSMNGRCNASALAERVAVSICQSKMASGLERAHIVYFHVNRHQKRVHGIES